MHTTSQQDFLAQYQMLHIRRTVIVLILIFSILTTLLILLPSGAEQQTSVYFHVKAQSDSPVHQQQKKQLHDMIIKECFSSGIPDLSHISPSDTEELLTEICCIADAALISMGSDASVTIELTDAYHPAFFASGRSLAAGTYPTLTVYIGEGNGHNCFSVLFPELSMWVSGDSSELATAPGLRADGNIYDRRVKIAEFISALFD